MNQSRIISAKAVLSFLMAALLPLTALSQSCATGKVDERVADFLKTSGPEKTLAQLKEASIEQLRDGVPSVFIKLSEDSVKRIKITKDNIKVNVVNASAKKNLPVIINFHQGGFIEPLLPWMEYEAMRLSKKFSAVVFDVDYRVAPEHKFPTPVDDAYNAYRWVVEHAKEYGGDPNKIILNGAGAGANLVALITHRAKKEGTFQSIKLAIMICPPTDNAMISYYFSYDQYGKGYLLTMDRAFFNIQTYLDKTEWYKNNPDVWPIHQKDFTGLPSSLLITTEFDILQDEGIAYAKKLEKAGNTIAIKCFPHQIHCFSGLPYNSGEMNRLYEIMGEEIGKAIGK